MLRKTLLCCAVTALGFAAHPAVAAPIACNVTVCATADVTIAPNGACTAGISSWNCPWRVTWAASGTSTTPGSMAYSVSTPGSGTSGSRSWTTGGATASGTLTGVYYGVYCGGQYLSASIQNTATSVLSASASDSQTILVKPPC